ncbi:hypothetical protein D3C84_998660 [compost metagenome]
MMEQVKKGTRRVTVFAVTQGLFCVKRRQRRARAEQPDQVKTQARTYLPMLLEELHAIDIATRETQARIALELQLLVEILFTQTWM